MEKPKFTCKNCPDRYAGCHDHCESYIRARASVIKERAKIRKEREKFYAAWRPLK